MHAWFQAYNHLTLTGDGTRVRHLSSDSCLTCESITSRLEDFYTAGGRSTIDGEPNTVVSIGPDQESTPLEGTTRLLVKFTTSAGEPQEAKYSKRVSFAAWRDVAGTVTTMGPPVDLAVREAVPVLTSGG